MRIEWRRSFSAVAATLTFVLSGCGPFHRGPQPEGIVVFHNQSIDQADIYALGSGGDPYRIGTVFAGRTESLRVPASVSGGASRINVIARIFPSGRVVATGPFNLGSGDSMDVTLTSDERMLSLLPSTSQ
jgi:hypothetical protein